MTNQTDLVLTPVKERAVIRTGTVLSSTASSVIVEVSGRQVDAGYLDWYTPVAGDLVALALQDASWLCLGRIAS